MKQSSLLKSLLLFIMILLSSCKLTLTGELEAYDPLSFKSKKAKYGPIEVAAGKYPATLSFKSKKKLYLTFKDEKKKKVLFKIPKGKKLPKVTGEFTLTSLESGQPYDLEGSIETAYSSSGQSSRFESCNEIFYRRVCRRDNEGRRNCYMDSYTEYGTREVSGHYEYTEKALSSVLKDPQNQSIVGKFYGKHLSSNYVSDYVGHCNVGYGGRHGRGFGRY